MSNQINLLHSVPYNEVVEVEQDLISKGLPEEEVFHLCDIHTPIDITFVDKDDKVKFFSHSNDGEYLGVIEVYEKNKLTLPF